MPGYYRKIAHSLVRYLTIGCVFFWFHPVVFAAVSQTPTQLYSISDAQTISITFTNSTDQTITEVNAYSDQTYVQMGEGSAQLDTCPTAERMDAGNWKFSGCSIEPGSVVNGSFPVIAANGEYTESDLSMNYTYGDSSNQVFVTISGTPASQNEDTPTPTPSSSSTTTVTTVITATPQSTIRPTATPVPDRAGPVIRVTTDVSKPFTVAPRIQGSITDPSGIASVSYSIDGGKNFSPVDSLEGALVKAFSFTPHVTLDDDYAIVLRGIDGAGNSSVYPAGTLVIDRMPPRIGAVLISLGSIVIDEKNGVIPLISGVPYHITISAVGGPVTMRVSANNQIEESILTKNGDTGLWEGTIKVRAPGDTRISVVARDGAENMVTTDVAAIRGMVSGVISDDHARLSHVKVRVFAKNTKGTFVLWNGAEYGQAARIETDDDGRYTSMLPSGTYYVEYEKEGYQIVRTRIFTFENASVVSADVTMHPRRGFWVWGRTWFIPLFDATTQTIDIRPIAEVSDEHSVSSVHIGETLPYVPFIYNGNPVSYLSFRGKPTLVTYLTLWSPTAIRQLHVINRLAVNTNIHVLGVFSQQTDSSVDVIAKRGLYKVALVADPDGIASEAVSLHQVPLHVIMDRMGIVRHVYAGFMDESALLDALVK